MSFYQLYKDNLCNLSIVPKSPITTFYKWYKKDILDKLSQSVREQVLSLEESKVNVIQENSEIFFNDKFLQEYKENFDNFNDLDVLAPIFRIFGFDFNEVSSDSESCLKVLQIGCGPFRDFKRGPKLDKILTSYGAEVVNLDINPEVKNYYENSIFVSGSWFELDNVLPYDMKDFDVIFVNSMNPYEMCGEARRRRQSFETTEMVYMRLFSQTISKLKMNGIFYISGIPDKDFVFPEYVCDNVYNLKMFYTHLNCFKSSAQIQFFQKKGI